LYTVNSTLYDPTDYNELYRIDGIADVFLSLNTQTHDFFWREISLFVGSLKGIRACEGGISAADAAF